MDVILNEYGKYHMNQIHLQKPQEEKIKVIDYHFFSRCKRSFSQYEYALEIENNFGKNVNQEPNFLLEKT